MTEIKASDGKLYVSAIFDCYDLAVLGLAMDTNMRATLCEQTLENACKAYPMLRGAIVSDLPFRGIKVNLVVSASFLDSNRYGSAPFALILDFPLIISISVKQCSAVRAIHRYRCPIIFCHAHHLIKFLDALRADEWWHP